jgi:hypothetical protein
LKPRAAIDFTYSMSVESLLWPIVLEDVHQRQAELVHRERVARDRHAATLRGAGGGTGGPLEARARHARSARGVVLVREPVLVVPRQLDDAGADARAVDPLFDVGQEDRGHLVDVAAGKVERHPAVDAGGAHDVHAVIRGRDALEQRRLPPEVERRQVDERVDADAARAPQRLDASADRLVEIEHPRDAFHGGRPAREVLVRERTAELGAVDRPGDRVDAGHRGGLLTIRGA